MKLEIQLTFHKKECKAEDNRKPFLKCQKKTKCVKLEIYIQSKDHSNESKIKIFSDKQT